MANQPSYTVGDDKSTLMYQDLAHLLDTLAENYPEKVAYVFRLRRKGELTRNALTYKQLSEKSLAVAASFLDVGIKPGDRIAIIGGNCPEYLFVDYACLRIKVLMMRLPPFFLNEEKLLKLLFIYSCVALVIDESSASSLCSFINAFFDKSMADDRFRELNTLKNIFILDKVPPTGTFAREIRTVLDLTKDSGSASSVLKIQKTIDPDDNAVILTTSGTTDMPKFVAYSHFGYINGMVNERIIPLPDPCQEIHLNNRSFTYTGGFAHLPVVYRCTMVLLNLFHLPEGRTIDMLYREIEDEMVTDAVLLPDLLYETLDRAKDQVYPPKSLKRVSTAGSGLPRELSNFMKTTFNHTAMIYGATEYLGVCAGVESREKVLDTGSISKMRCFPHCEIKIVNNDDKIVPRGQLGDIHVRTPFAMTGYLRDIDATYGVRSKSGWIHVGDVGIMDDEGLVQFVGRTTEVISKGTTKIHPKILEDVLNKHPKVDRVLVVGVPDPRLFQEICACIQPKPQMTPTEQELSDYCRSSLLDDAIIPKYYVFLDDFPAPFGGKSHRIATAEVAMKKLGMS